MQYLIVGQGLAGTMLAHQFLKTGKTFKIIDPGVNESSRVAAGIMNPIVFRRVTKSWMVDQCLPEAVRQYRELEELLGVRFLFEREIRRAFSSEQEKEWWEQKSALEEFNGYIDSPGSATPPPTYLKAPFGNEMVHRVHYVETKMFIDTNRSFFKEKGVLLEDTFDYDCITDEGCLLDGIRFDKIIFCEGYQSRKNPFFSYLPVNATKGQILDLEIPLVTNRSEVLNRKCFVLPLENGAFKAGATYEWDSPDTLITEAARKELEEKIAGLIDAPFSVTGQEAGVRPTTDDRRPLLGCHPERDDLYFFNGLGTKGYLLAPYFAGEIFLSVTENKPVLKDADLVRFAKRRNLKNS